MIYLFILLFITFYLYSVRNLVSSSFLRQFIVWIPCFLVFFIPMALQNDVGTDYASYTDIYNYESERFLYQDKKEYLFLWLVSLVKVFNNPQSVFILFSFIISIFFFFSLHLLRREYEFKPWLLFFIYFTSTGIYNTSFNTLRQSVIVAILPLLIHLFIKNKHFLFLFLIIFLSFLHKSSLFYLIFYPLLLLPKSKKLYLFLFSLSAIVYAVDFKSIVSGIMQAPIFSNLFGNYAYYADSAFFDGGSILSVLTKLYYIPVFILFWIFYIKDDREDKFFDFSIRIWSITCLMIIQIIHIGLFYRFWNMFVFLYLFPIYYIIDHFIKKKNYLAMLLILVYLILPYIVKTLFFPESEYLYNFYDFIF